MRIVQINPGHLTIPPNGWGAVEKIIWEYKLGLEKLGHDVDVKYINEVKNGDYDIVHVHMWNHALELLAKNIPYIFTFHDHHAYAYGKSSLVYKNNLAAIKGAELAIVPAKYLVEYFDNVPVYLSHGVDSELYKPSDKIVRDMSILCVGNNGFGGDSTFDRKGFTYAINAAKDMDIPITIVGPTDYNKEFFEAHEEHTKYDKLTIKYDLTDEELVKEYQSHKFLVHATSVEAGHPPLTILEAASCGLPVLTTDCAGDLLTVAINRDYESIIQAIRTTNRTYELHRANTLDSARNFEWSVISEKLYLLYESSLSNSMKSSILKAYNKLERVQLENTITANFIDGPFFEMTGPVEKNYTIQFIDNDRREVVYETKLKNNQWAKCNRSYFANWLLRMIPDDNPTPIDYSYDVRDKRVLIAIDSKSLGDNIAWIPYIDEFRKKHGCYVIVSTFWNKLFESEYPNLNFVEPGTAVDGLYASYKIGLWYDENGYDRGRHPTNFLDGSMQDIASDILGLERKEIRTKVKKPEVFKADKPYICIANHSTAQAKYWNNPTGWQELVDYVKSKGYDVYSLSKERSGYMGNNNPTGVIEVHNKSIEEIGSILCGSELFVGLGSGLSWYAWALDVPIILISGFSDPNQEMKEGVTRIHNHDVCNGCFARHYFDKGDWNWCPDHKGTDRQFECSKTITFDMVRPHLDKHLT